MSFLRNTWYLAAWAAEVKAGELFHRRILNEPVVLFRKGEAWEVAALHGRRANAPPRFSRTLVNQVVAQPRAAVIVREGDHHLLAFEAEFPPGFGEDGFAHHLRHTLEIAGDQHHPRPFGIFQRQGLHVQVLELSLRGMGAVAVAG